MHLGRYRERDFGRNLPLDVPRLRLDLFFAITVFDPCREQRA